MLNVKPVHRAACHCGAVPVFDGIHHPADREASRAAISPDRSGEFSLFTAELRKQMRAVDSE